MSGEGPVYRNQADPAKVPQNRTPPGRTPTTDNELERTKTQLARMTAERDALAAALKRIRLMIDVTNDNIARGV